MAAKHGFLERTTASFVNAMEHAFYAEQTARAEGLLQRLDPRVKLLGILALIVAAAAARSFAVIAGLFAVAVVLAVLSNVLFGVLLKRVWIPVLLFTGVIALPAPFVTPGRVVYHLHTLGWSVTAQGLVSAGYLVLRVETAATLCVLLVLTTPWSHILKALRVLHVPAVLVAILGMTYRYLFLVLQSASAMFESRRSRMVGELAGRERRRLAASSAGVLMSKTFDLSNEVYLAMQSRGYRGDFSTLDEFHVRSFDRVMLGVFAVVSIIAFWLGR
ncbi:MAG: cobalt ECF transporter T component CbiQ [Acidobacteria bacterium]|nr:MAG: cobalt ECF transporter T component CbiQ [Acidobacteriota bacterium]